MAEEIKFDEFESKTVVNVIRALSIDTVQKANSGHPGMPLGMAPIAHVLWSRFLKFDSSHPKWLNRDRFVLSNGHGCALLYSMLHLTGYDVTLNDLKSFRQLGSKTPGHPEAGVTEGIEVTTGPLGQGIANAVGIALSELHLASIFNKPNYNIIDNYTYCFCGDGCMMEGISGEASSLAGHLGLGKLILIYDDNKITIDGSTNLAFTENVPKRYEAFGWHVQTVEHGDDDLAAIAAAIAEAKRVKDKPHLIAIRTTIGFGSAKAGDQDVHGSPLGAEGVAKTKTALGLNPEEFFHVPEAVHEFYKNLKNKGHEEHVKWNTLFQKYEKDFPQEAAELLRRFSGKLPEGWKNKLPTFSPQDKADATRGYSGKVLNALADVIPELVGGAADLTPSTKTQLKVSGDFQHNTPQGRYIRFGVREHAMCAIGNGMFAYGGILPFTSTFLNFIEYAFPAVRLSALSHFQQILIMTHDSIGLGEDGPTHQPIEAVAICRATPNIHSFRPADGNETVGSYICALENNHGPSVLSLSRQTCPNLKNSSAASVALGAYVIHDTTDGKETPDLVLVATGSEVGLCVEAASKLSLKVRVVSMPCWELFNKQSTEYRQSVITPGVPTLSVEALSTMGWERYSHHCLGMKTFGASGPDKDVFKHFGFTVDGVIAQAQHLIQRLELVKQQHGAIPALPTHYEF